MDSQELEQELELEMLETDIGTFTENKILGLSAQEVYEKELKRREQIDNCPPKTTEEKVEDLISQVTVMDEIIANLTLEVL